MDHDFDLGNDIKDDIIPLALEYYLGVVQQEEEEDDSDSDGDGDNSDDDSDASKPKKAKKQKPGAAKGPQGEDCK